MVHDCFAGILDRTRVVTLNHEVGHYTWMNQKATEMIFLHGGPNQHTVVYDNAGCYESHQLVNKEDA